MYHISCDKRALDSAHRIRLALEKLLDTNPFESITISQICAAAEVSRTTFYRLFDIPEDKVVLCAIALGYPDEERQNYDLTKLKYEKIHHETYHCNNGR
mgnify:CR=1 FL=1